MRLLPTREMDWRRSTVMVRWEQRLISLESATKTTAMRNSQSDEMPILTERIPILRSALEKDSLREGLCDWCLIANY